jgi:RNA polymerase sigma-70 factor (ECF subfamily)
LIGAGEEILGTPQALDRFLANVEQRAYRMAVFATGHRDEALDIVQDAMLKLAHKYSDRDAEQWGPLFHRILQNAIMDWHRRQKVQKTWRVFLDFTGLSKSADKHEESRRDCVPELPATDDSPMLKLANERTLQALDGAIEQLPVRQQQAFLLRIWEGLSVEETAEAMKCSQGSVKTHLSRAVLALRKQLEDYRL